MNEKPSPESSSHPTSFLDRTYSTLTLALGLTATTGMVDAIGYLGLGKVFTANMTGNIVLLGISAAGGHEVGHGAGPSVIGPAVSLCGFTLGAGLTGRITRGARSGWGRRTSAMFLTTGIGVTLVGVLCTVLSPSADLVWRLVVAGTLSSLMGLQAATARWLGITDVTTVVVTSTLTGLAADSRLAGGDGHRQPRRLLAIGMILAGAAMVRVGVGAAPVLAGLMILTVVTAGQVLIRRAPTRENR